jgi:hypothetical protein
MFSTVKRPQFREQWFFVAVLPIVVAIEWAFASTLDWALYPRSEWILLVDLCIFTPLVYFTFFGPSRAMRVRLIRTAGVAGIGILAARFIVPDANQFLLADLAILRNALLVFVIAFEIWVFGKIVSALYRRNATERELERDFAMPAWIARLMLLEAKFWKAVWRSLRGK